MKSKNKVVVGFLVVSIGILSYLGFTMNSSIQKVNYEVIENDSQLTILSLQDSNISDVSDIYSQDLQTKIFDQITYLKENNEYTFDNLLVITNPYGTNTTGLYLYFQTKENLQVTYTIHTENTSDFTRTLDAKTSTGYTKEHEYQLIGIVPGVKNEITLSLSNEDGKEMNEKVFSYMAPELSSGEEYETLEIEEGTSTEEISDGLYTVLGNDITESEENDYVYLYDNEGVIRMEIPIIDYRAHRLLFDDESMYLSISESEIAAIDNVGRVEKVYDTGDYLLHHDYIFNSDGNIWVLATKEDSDTVEDHVLELDVKTGEVKELLDLATLLSNYKDRTVKPEDEDKLDWLHINSIQLVDGDSMLLSSRETSTIIKVNDIYNEPKLDYMIGSEDFWKESGYDSYVLQQEGDFQLQGGQHSITYVLDEKLEVGQYYLYLYNNNNTVSTTRLDFDWKSYDYYKDTATATSLNWADEGYSSYYYKYLVDENRGTFSLESKIDVEYSGYVSSVQEYKDNIIIDSGSAFTINEYDKYHKLIQKLIGSGDKYFYRVYKYDYIGFWFR